MYYLLDQINDVTRTVGAATGCLVIDAAAEVDWQEGDFYDFYHNTPAGAKRLGDYIYDALRPHLED